MHMTPTLTKDGLDPQNISHTWIPAAEQHGICLIDMCGNTAAALEASLKAGWKVSKYVYVDNDPDAMRLAQATVSRLMRKYPHALTEDAMDAFDNSEIPMDMNDWHAGTIKRLMQGHEQKPWLVCCGLPCQDNNLGGPGLGAEGHRSTLFDTIIPLDTHSSVASAMRVLAREYNHPTQLDGPVEVDSTTANIRQEIGGARMRIRSPI